MQEFSSSIKFSRVLLVLLLAAGSVALVGSSKSPYSPRDKAYYADPNLVAFVRPGLKITVNSASISSGGAITVTYTLTDPQGLPLDATGVDTPGAVSMTYFASYIPNGQEQYVAYTTAQATGPKLGTITRPTFEIGAGTLTSLGNGQYQYVYKATAPAGFDASATTTVGLVGSRNLTQFDLGTNYAGTTYSFVPNGAAVTVTRDVIKTSSCNACHDQLAFHGGHAVGIDQCVLCHQPQNQDPTTGNTLDFKVMIHKIHMGSQLPSAVAGTPYQIAGFGGRISDFSDIVDPADVRRCEVCHDQKSGAAQAKVFMTEPSRLACGACHDDVNFADGTNHAGGVQPDDKQCANCHVPIGEFPFDASILGAHVVENDTPLTYPANPDTAITSVVVKITGVTNGMAGQKPVVAYTVKDVNGNPIALNDPTLEDIQFTMAGPTSDYGYTSFGSDVTTPGYVGEDGTKGTCDASGNCTYTFQHAVPANATGTYAIGVESERLETVLTGFHGKQQMESGTPNSIFYFSVDGSKVAPRRAVVAETNCNQCHANLTLHGNRRNDPNYCVFCHNPSDTDFSQAPQGATPQTINMAVMVHRIHFGANAAADNPKAPFIIYGHGGRKIDFSNVGYPAMSPTGSTQDLENCSMCHVNGSEANLPLGLNQVSDPQGWINPVQAIASACSGCHVAKDAAAHFLANTDSLGESCTVCHASGAQFDVDKVHAQ